MNSPIYTVIEFNAIMNSNAPDYYKAAVKDVYKTAQLVAEAEVIYGLSSVEAVKARAAYNQAVQRDAEAKQQARNEYLDYCEAEEHSRF